VDSWTIQKIAAWAADDFKKRGLESPRLEAEILLATVLGVDRVRLIIDGQRPLSEQDLSAYRAVIQRRRSGEPVAYILGKREFYGRDFFVDKRVLIPRPDTEILLEAALEKTAHRHLSGRALDLCTGSGCVALSFALERRTWQVTGTDLSDDALEVAQKNAVRLGALWGVRFVPGDLFAALKPGEKFELITANPPYIPDAEIAELEAGVRDFEPQSALAGGASGLDFYQRICQEARQFLVPGGVLAFEVGAGQAPDVERLLLAAGFERPERKRDLGGHERVVTAHAPKTAVVSPPPSAM
jgi:release factor glutamine methyltransferase